MGMFIAPNQTGIMNSLPASQRGAGAGMAGTFNSSAQVLSIGIFFTLMILGLASTLPTALYHGLTSQGVNAATALRVSHLPPVGSLFAAFLGYNPMQTLLGPTTLSHLSPATAHYLTSREFFPQLISKPFSDGLTEAFAFAAGVCALGAVASLLRGGKYHYQEPGTVADPVPEGAVAVEQSNGAGPNGNGALVGAEPVISAEEAVAETEPLLAD
jgi:hypothetical protein